MPNTLRSSIDELASAFASSIVAAIKASSLDQILNIGAATAPASASRAAARRPASRPHTTATAEKPAKKSVAKQSEAVASAVAAKSATSSKKTAKGRLRRRSPAEIAKALSAIVELVKKSPKGLRAEQIRAQLKMEAKEMPRVLKEGLGKKVLKSKGQKRSTTYTAS